MGNVYALLVGIDRYQIPTPLQGCVNDVQAMANYLEVRFGSAGNGMHLKTLLDEQATRQAILETFQGHLNQAGPGDTALFFYAGHGGQELTPPLFLHGEADKLDETLVAWDSRLTVGGKEGLDVADKELAVLIAEVAQRGGHVVAILDSCHSGTASRPDAVARRAVGGPRDRPSGSFCFLSGEIEFPENLNVAGGWRVLPRGRHVLLSACRDFELACETVTPEGDRHGVFSSNLIRTLRQTNQAVSYHDLHKRVQTLVRNSSNNAQVPQAEGDLRVLLFDGSMSRKPLVFHISKVREGGWRLGAGAMHGIQPGAELAVFPAGAPALTDLTERIATVSVSQVGPAESAVTERDGALDPEAVTLPAVLTYFPFPPLGVALETASQGLRQALAASPLLAEAPDRAEVVVTQRADGYHIRRPQAVRDLALAPLRGGDGIVEVIRDLEHIARWEVVRTLENPGSRLKGALEMALHEWIGPPRSEGGRPDVRRLDPDPLLRYDGLAPPRFTVELHNRTDEAVHYALLALDESFGIRVIDGSTGRLAAGHTVWVREYEGIPANVPEPLYHQGVTQRRDILVLLTSEVEADCKLLEQEGLGADFRLRSMRSGRPGVLDVLMRHVAVRDIDRLPRPLEVYQWAVQVQEIVTEWPARRVRLSDVRSLEIELGGGVWLRHCGAFDTAVQLLNAPSAARILGSFLTPPSVPGVPMRSLALAGRMASDAGLSVLELEGRDFSSVHSAMPLRISASNTDVEPGEVPLAVAFDGLDFWLVGAAPAAGSQRFIEMTIVGLPSPRQAARLPEGRRHLARRIWLLFQAARAEEIPADWAHPERTHRLAGA